MAAPFVWFDNIGSDRSGTTDFLAKTFGWTPNDIGPMTMLANGDGPFAATADIMEGLSDWVPYIEVEDLGDATKKAIGNGTTVMAADLQGPAGVATFVRDPGGSTLALWKRG